MANGITLFGVIRKRADDLLQDFAARIKLDKNGNPGGAFGAMTTLDSPDTYPSDALVQIATTASASDAEIWEGIEFFYAQLDPNQARGVYLERFHGIPKLGLPKLAAETWDEYDSRIRLLLSSGATRYDAEVAAINLDSVDCAAQVRSTVFNPVAGMPAPSSMLVVKGCDVDYDALAATIWANTEIGAHDWVGDQAVNYNTANGGCIEMRFQPACRIFVDLNIEGYFTGDACDTPIAELDVMNEAVARLVSVYNNCGFGQRLTSSDVRDKLSGLNGFIVTNVTFRRRAPQLFAEGCDTSGAVMVEVCGEVVPWASSMVGAGCTYCTAEVWCEDRSDCLQLNPWEFPDFNIAFAALQSVEPETC